jgi:hypothetical protein
LLWKKSAIAISRVALLLFRISPIFCIKAEIDGCIKGRGKGDFLLGYDEVLEDDEVTLAPSLTENDANEDLVPRL